MSTFREIAARDRIRFIGNVQVVDSGADDADRGTLQAALVNTTVPTDATAFSTSTVSVVDLLKVYSAVIFATGASGDKRLGIPGEELTVRVINPSLPPSLPPRYKMRGISQHNTSYRII